MTVPGTGLLPLGPCTPTVCPWDTLRSVWGPVSSCSQLQTGRWDARVPHVTQAQCPDARNHHCDDTRNSASGCLLVVAVYHGNGHRCRGAEQEGHSPLAQRLPRLASWHSCAHTVDTQACAHRTPLGAKHRAGAETRSDTAEEPLFPRGSPFSRATKGEQGDRSIRGRSLLGAGNPGQRVIGCGGGARRCVFAQGPCVPDLEKSLTGARHPP